MKTAIDTNKQGTLDKAAIKHQYFNRINMATVQTKGAVVERRRRTDAVVTSLSGGMGNGGDTVAVTTTTTTRREVEEAAMGRRGGKLGWAAMAKEATSKNATSCLWLCSRGRGKTR